MAGQGESLNSPPADYSDAVELCQQLIRLDTSNYRDRDTNERPAAEFAAAILADCGLQVDIVEPQPGRTSIFARLPGRNPDREALLLHGHLDVVPADASEWTVDPFGGELRDGYVWGRGAVDMKDMDAMILSVIRRRILEGRIPARDIVIAFFADEEAGGQLGSANAVRNHSEIFEGVTEAVSEVGGFSVTIADNERAYFMETAIKGVAWIKATARGRSGHGSLTNAENAVTRLSAAVGRIGEHVWPHQRSDTSDRMIAELSSMMGIPLDPESLDLSGTPLANVAGLITSTLRHTANPTILRGGDTINMVPQEAHAYIDGRFIPGFEKEFLASIKELLGPKVQLELDDLTPSSVAPGNVNIVEAMRLALQAEDPGSRVIPYCNAASTDNAQLAPLGIHGYGFAPLQLPPDFNFAEMFHGVDERVPEASIRFGARTLDRFLDLC
jgi:acetylornithine deacetylase/succinyl-diaminopimelate desuccinylase-like protein